MALKKAPSARPPRDKSKYNKNKLRNLALKKGRPPTAAKTPAKLSKIATNKLINHFHILNKSLAKAEASGDEKAIDMLRQEIKEVGGLRAYQMASIQGQAKDRGGDSSMVLMDWLRTHLPQLKALGEKLRMLEIGSLSIHNACSRSKLFNIERIDLNSQSEGIIQQDFMARPRPKNAEAKFDIISLSLVINYVPEPADRGEMLRRTLLFLDRKRAQQDLDDDLAAAFPALFLVLPASCVTNSRYMDEEQLTLIMSSLGYVLTHRKQSTRIVYYLWLLRDSELPDEQAFPKHLLRDGPKMNNFSIVLR